MPCEDCPETAEAHDGLVDELSEAGLRNEELAGEVERLKAIISTIGGYVDKAGDAITDAQYEVNHAP